MATFNITSDGVYAGSVDADDGAQALRVWALLNTVTICEQPPPIDEGREYGARGKGTDPKGHVLNLEATPEPEREPDPDAVLIDGMWYVLTQDRGYAMRASEKHAVYESRDCMRFAPMKKGAKRVDT